MKIFEIIPAFAPVGGAEMFVKTLTIEMKRRFPEDEFVVVSLYDKKDNALVKDLMDNGVEVVFIGKKKGIDFACAKRLRKLIDERKPDVCHLHLHSLLTLFLSRRTKRQKNYYTIHTNVTEQSYGSRRKPLNVLTKHLFKSKKVQPVSISRAVDKSVRDYFGIANTSIIYNGTNIELFGSEIPLEKRKNTFIGVGRFLPVKNYMLMIKAFAHLHKEFPDTNLVLLGDGSLRKECEDYVKEKGITGIEFKGVVDNVNEYMKDSKCFLMSSLWEGNPIVINEAIASGCWVISTAVGGVPDLIDDTCGFLSKPEDEEDLYMKMKEFILNEDDISETITKSREVNLKKVSIKNSAEQYMKLFEEHL